MQTVYLSAYISLPAVETKIELDTHADTCVVGDHCLIVHDHNKPVSIYINDLKAGLYANIVDATIAYIEPETGQLSIRRLK